MNEVKSPKKPLIYYYMIVVLLVLLFNLLAMPWLAEHQIKEVDYNTFVSMTEKNEIGQVEIQQQSNRILFTSTDGKTIYKTASWTRACPPPARRSSRHRCWLIFCAGCCRW